MRSRTSLAAIPAALLVLSACGGHKADADPKPHVTPTTAAATAPTATASATPSATRTPPPGQAEVEAQVKQALIAAKAPTDGADFSTRSCVVSYEKFDVGRHVTDFRKEVVASLHAAGWKDGPGGGAEETELTNADGWEVFVDQRDVGKLNGTGSPTQELHVSADCT